VLITFTKGVYVQFMMGSALFVFGLVMNIVELCPPFYPLAMVGGALFACGKLSTTIILECVLIAGNLTSIPSINRIGMGLSLLISSVAEALVGWATSRFGWFGTKPQVPSSDRLNYIGMAVIVFRYGLLLFIQYCCCDCFSSALYYFVHTTPPNQEGLAQDGDDDLNTSEPNSDVFADIVCTFVFH
jgi:hypothetical protein